MTDKIEFKPKIYFVPSETDKTKEYTVTNYRPNRWRCSCKSYAYRSKDRTGHAVKPPYLCKHILMIKNSK